MRTFLSAPAAVQHSKSYRGYSKLCKAVKQERHSTLAMEWDNNPFASDDNPFSCGEDPCGFDLDFGEDIFSDESASQSSAQSHPDFWQPVSGTLSPIETPPTQPVTMPAIPFSGNLPRRRFGASVAKTRPLSRYQSQVPMPMKAPMLIAKIDLAAMEKFQARTRRRNVVPWTSATESAIRSDQLFNDLIRNPAATLNPARLGFIPSFFWPDRDIPFVDLVYDFFQRKNNVNCRFIHKLYDALRMATVSAVYAELAGVQWVSPNVIRVAKGQFARLLGIKSIDGSLFHQQGNFTTQGFVELNREQAAMYCPNFDVSQVDFDDVRLIIHQPGIFTSTATEQQLMMTRGRP